MEFYASVDGLVMGSGTYEFALKQGKWQSPDKPSWVFTRRDLPVLHPSITMTSDDPAKVMETMIGQGLKRVWLMGGGKLATSFRMQGLITHYWIAIIPIVLGGGIPLFANAERQNPLELVEAKTHKSGIVQLYYEPKKKN